MLGATSRDTDRDYIKKGMMATRLAVSPRMTILACYEHENSENSYVSRMGINRRHRQTSQSQASAASGNGSYSPMRRSMVEDHGKHSHVQEAGAPGAVDGSTLVDELYKFSVAFNAKADMNKAVQNAKQVSSPVVAAITTSESKPRDKKRFSLVINTDPPKIPSNFIALWEGEVNHSPKIVFVEHAVTAVAFGMCAGRAKDEMSVMGLVDGRLLICMLPIPVMVVDNRFTFTALSSLQGKLLGRYCAWSITCLYLILWEYSYSYLFTCDCTYRRGTSFQTTAGGFPSQSTLSHLEFLE